MKKSQYRFVAFFVAVVIVLVVAFRHPEAALALVAGAFAIIGSIAGINI